MRGVIWSVTGRPARPADRPEAPLIDPIRDKRIVLGVSGSIAAYKAVALASELTRSGALVDVILTPAAVRFVHCDISWR